MIYALWGAVFVEKSDGGQFILFYDRDLPSYMAQVVVVRVDTEVGEVKEVSFKVAIECMIMQLEDTTEEAEAVIMAA